MTLEYIDLNEFSPVVAGAMRAFASVIDSDGSFEAFESAQEQFYATVGSHKDVGAAEIALGF